MADKIFHSTAVTFVDMTDSRKLDVYISSNHPTVQLYDSNKTTSKYTPDWSVANLELEASFYLDSQSITPANIKWYTKIGTTKNELTSFQNKDTLLIAVNSLASNPIITYICEATYDTLSAFKEITFTRVDTGLNGTNGSPAPAVQAQYSVDGSAWTSTLNAATHKYIRYSYDGGKTYTTAIKMVGEDGTSVRILGTATSATQVTGTNYYTLVYSSSAITSAALGDAYLYNGDLYVCADSRDGQDYFINVGKIQGPTGNDGQSSYLFIRYATDASGTGMSTNPSGKTYMGVYTSNTNVAPTTANSYTWTKFVGDSAKSIILSGDSQVFKMSTSNVATPTTIKVTAQAFNTSVTTWTYSTNGGQTFVSTAPTGVSRNGTVVTVTGSTLTTNSIVIKASDGTVEDVFTVYKAFDGSNGNPGAPGTPASMTFLTNENVSFAANASGQIAATSITTNVVAYNGTTKTTPTIGTIANLPTGMTATIGTVVNNEVPIVFTIASNATLGSASSNNGSITIPVTSPVNTNLILSWSKVNAGPQGPQGNRGNDAYTVLLTNESHVFAGDVSKAVDGSTTTQVLAYNGSAAQTVTISSINGKVAATTDTDTGIAGLKFKCSALSGTSPTITFTCTDDFVGPSGTIPIVLSVGGVSFTKMFTYSIAFKGSIGNTGSQGPQGTAATSYWLVSSASAVQKTSTGTITVTPSTLTFTGKSKTGTNAPVDYACRWVIDSSTDGTTYTNLYTSTANEASKSITVATTYKTIRARMYMAGGTTALLDEQIIPVVVDGTSASLVDITPSAYYFKSTTGKDGTFTPDYIYLYPRFQTVTFSKWEYSINGGTTWVAASGANGISISTYNSVANTLRIAKTSTLYTDTVTSISFRCVSSNASVYDTVSIAKIYDVVDLQIGGRNLAEKTNQGVANWLWSMQTGDYTREEYIDSNQIKCCKLTKGATTTQTGWSVIEYTNIGLLKYEPNQTYTISFDVLSSVTTTMSVRLLKPDGTNDLASVYTSINKQVTANVWSKIIYTTTTLATLPELAEQCLYITGMSSSNGVSYIFKNVKIEKGNKATDYSPAPEDLKSTTFQLYAPKGYLITNDVPTVTLETFAYDGSQPITGATFVWSRWNGEAWTAISGATGTSLTLNKSNVLKSVVYKCEMTYGDKVYTATATVEDKTDVYDSLIHITSKYSSTNRLYWVLYSTVYSEEGERDELLGPISTTAPSSPTTGSYWYKVDETNYTVTLMKYSGTAWATTTDKQELVYDWFLLNDVDKMITLGAQSKVKIVTANDFSRTCSVQCNVSDAELILLTHNNQILTDPSDPIISATAPTNPINGQLWIKTNANDSYVLSVWDSSSGKWVVSEADTQNKVYVTKPTQYNTGDLWIVDSNYQPIAYDNGVVQTYRHPEKTMLRATATSQTYNDAHWVEALKYQKELDNVIEDVEKFKQFMSIDDTGLIMQAKGANGTVSDFKTVLTNTELGFYQGASRVAYINNNQLNISKAEITNGMVVGGTTPELQIGNFVLIQESNGSLSIGLKS